jgi:hypothetical protein
MEPGMTLFAVRERWNGARDPALIVDEAGGVRWYYLNPDNPVHEDLKRLENGNLLFGKDSCSLREIDLLGNVVNMWHASLYPRACEVPSGSIPVPVESFHHELEPLADGTFLVLSTESREVDGYPTSEDDPDAPRGTALVMGSVIVEFTPDGEIVKYISLLDLLDPTRISRSSLSTQWPSGFVPDGVEARDWDHANTVIYDEASDAYYVSLRHQDAVVKIDRTSEALLWILGTPSNWVAPWRDRLLSPEGDLQWPFHQHGVEITPLGFGMYDNGNFRAAAFEPPGTEYSRAVIYAVDEAAMTVREAWQHGAPSGEDHFYSSAMGDADWQVATGNVLLVNSNIVTQNGRYAEILEVTPEGERVFQLELGGAPDEVYTVYTAERIADIRQ